MKRQHQKLFARTKSARGRRARALTLSLCPRHLGTLQRLALELNVSPSVSVQALLEIKDRESLVRRELLRRLSDGITTPAAAPAP